DGCKMMFEHASDAKRHAESHTTGRPYKCSRCDKGFGGKDAMLRHERRVQCKAL
ncbi:hypothetical protein C8R44DRAFT_649281, partial [Mycena epipterygia]